LYVSGKDKKNKAEIGGVHKFSPSMSLYTEPKNCQLTIQQVSAMN